MGDLEAGTYLVSSWASAVDLVVLMPKVLRPELGWSLAWTWGMDRGPNNRL